jgi:hypothetical protein
LNPWLAALLIVILAGVALSVRFPVFRRHLPVWITGIVGVMMVTAVFIPQPLFMEADDKFSVFFDIIAGVAFILGGGNLLKIHWSRIERRVHHWGYSVVTLIGFFVMLGAGLYRLPAGYLGIGSPESWQRQLQAPGTLFDWLYQSTFSPLQSTMFSLLAFFVASASYRAFRAKTREATLLLVAATIILVGRTPLGHYLTFWLPGPLQFFHIPNLSGWILSIPNLAGQRAILIGIALGIISTSLKIILGIERSYLGSKES